jgi:hypothetical protein
MKAGGAKEKNDKKLFSASSRQVFLGYDLRNGRETFSNALALSAYAAKSAIRVHRPITAMVNPMRPFNGTPERLSFRIETNDRRSPVTQSSPINP